MFCFKFLYAQAQDVSTHITILLHGEDEKLNEIEILFDSY